MTVEVSICIATYKRPELLANLLNSINQLEFNHVEQPLLEVIVVDNDALGSAKSTYDQIRASFKWLLSYDVEPQQGVTYARNRTIANASTTTDFIVFIDDDEIPESSWLDALLAAQNTYQADVVTGPVYPKFQSSPVPQWVEEGGFFDPPSHKTGQLMEKAYTNNVLLRAALVRQLDIAFDPRFAFKGSEDSCFFMRLRKIGAKIVWTNEAVVYEIISPKRTTLRWVLERGFWGWSSYSLLEKELFPSPQAQLIRFAKGIALIVLGVLSSLPSLLVGKHHFYKAILNIYRGSGTLSGLMGIQGNWPRS